MKATAFGKCLRKIRIEQEILLKDMASVLDVSSAYLSSLELGKKSISDAIVTKICSSFNLNSKQINQLKDSVALSQPSVKIDLVGKSNDEREMVMSFARRYESLSESERKKVMKMLGD
ncbi:helix-turn-helix domain-containing protein [Photobacterium ganghwense]|uniref:helix-turn-helix domain-containing protein n=1 Tax=Photobacterium ganghwense TaxID=320778 RepID=UPI001A8C6A2B|nr:helix-turn-helix transcriptional regulator [Photobacterium ganghwense]QSV13591.1 helix-turn-helix transcriptional regulator [Photobacterium ganghwense]